MEEKQFKYYAFISYCSADEKWAKWLHRHLENYHIPTRLCSEYPTLPKKIRPVFWYKVDLSGTKLKSSLDKELEASNYLIVVCSPESAKSDWVNDEVISFINKHSGHRIIPVIVAGEPKSGNPRTECFPPALRNLPREDELRGISIPQAGKYRALVDIVATMFNVRFDSLWQRHRRRQLRNRIIGTILGFMVLLCGIFAFNYFRTSRSYFANYELCLGMPVGIDPLKKSELKTKTHFYVFESSRGKLRRVYLSNPFGHPLDESSSWAQLRTAILDLAYEGDRLSSITYSDASGNPQYKFVYSDDYRRADIKDIESGDAASMFKSSSSTFESMVGTGTFDLNNVFNSTKSQVARYVYDYDPDGYIATIHFKRYNGSNETGYDDNGICGIEYVRDASHRVTQKRYLDENGEYMADKMGCAGVEYAYNDHSDIVYERFFDLDGNNQLCDMGYAISRMDYNLPDGTLLEESHFGTDNKPIMTLANYHRSLLKIKGDTAITTYFDTDQQPTLFSFPQRNYGLFHMSKNVFDKNGMPVELAFFGTDSMPCYDMIRAHKFLFEYDDQGRCTKNIVLNPDGERQLNLYGISELCISYADNSNNPATIEYFRRPGVRANIYNVSRRTFGYSGNKIVRSSIFDSNDLPTTSALNLGVPTVLLDYDDFGNVSDIWLKDAAGTTQAFPDTYASHAKASYSNGNCVKLEYFDKHGRPATIPPGYSAITMEYDKRGRRTATEYLDTLGHPVVLPNLQYARMESVFDPQGHEIEQRTFDENGNPTIGFDGWAVKKQHYNDYLVTRIESYGVNGEPTLAKNSGAHAKEMKYDASRRLISEKYLGLHNEPIMNDEGIHERRIAYNSQGLVTEISTFGTNGRPVKSTKNFHKRVNEYDSRYNLVAEKYFDTAGRLTENTELGFAYGVSEFSPSGQLLSIRVYGPDSQPAENNNGVHMVLNSYTPAGDQVLWSFLDKNFRPVPDTLGNNFFAVMYNIYDDEGNFRGAACYGTDFIEYRAALPLIENGKQQGLLWRENLLETKLTLPDGTERTLDRYSDSPYDRALVARLDSLSDALRDEAKRIIEQSH